MTTNIKCATISSIFVEYTRPSSLLLRNTRNNELVWLVGLKNLTEKPPRPLVWAIGEELRRRPVLHNDAAVGEIDLVGNLAGKAHFVGDDDAGHSLLGELANGDQHLFHGLRVERGRHLVEQHGGRLHGEAARNGNALLLAACKLARVGILPAGEPQLAHP